VETNMTELVKKQSLIPAEMAEQIIKLTNLKKEVASKLDDLKAELLRITQENDVYTLKTGQYTISRGHRDTVNILDHKSAFDYLIERDIPAETVTRLSPETESLVKGMVKKGTPVNGASLQQTEYISVRVAKEK
jgi:hypothetical protein